MKKIITVIIMTFSFTFAKSAHPEDAMIIMNMSDYMFFAGNVTAADPNCYSVVEGIPVKSIYPMETAIWQKFIDSQNSNIPIDNWTVHTGTNTFYSQALASAAHPSLSLSENYAEWGGYITEYIHPDPPHQGLNIAIGHYYNSNTNICSNYGQTHVDQYIEAFTFTGTNALGGTDYLLYIDNA